MLIAIVPDGLAGLRADLGTARLFGLSRSQVEQAAERGGLSIDGKVVAKSELLRAGAMVEVDIEQSRPIEVNPSLVEGMAIAYQDADIVVVDKPSGVAAHPSLGWEGPTVLEHLLAAGISLSEYGPAERQGIVSRLDVGTSGLMVLARSNPAYVHLKAAFRERQVNKVYHTLVQGYPDPDEGTIDAPIGHARTGEWKMAIDPAGRAALTHYSRLETVAKATLLRIKLETGRTHQIRVHMAAIHHPCVGDLLYGADPVLTEQVNLKRQWLHAVELGLQHPRSGQMMTFTSSYPEDLAQALDILR